jgi:hypothetical protein
MRKPQRNDQPSSNCRQSQEMAHDPLPGLRHGPHSPS